MARKKAAAKAKPATPVEPDILEIRWRKGFRPAADVPAEKAYQEITKIMAEKGYDDVQQCTAEDVFSWAESRPKSSLHALIADWDDHVAARQWRINQARVIIRAVFIVYKEAPDRPTRAFEVDKSQWQKSDGYKPYRNTRDIMADPEARAALLQRALSELISMRRKYSTLQELSIVFRAVDELLETIKV